MIRETSCLIIKKNWWIQWNEIIKDISRHCDKCKRDFVSCREKNIYWDGLLMLITDIVIDFDRK